MPTNQQADSKAVPSGQGKILKPHPGTLTLLMGFDDNNKAITKISVHNPLTQCKNI